MKPGQQALPGVFVRSGRVQRHLNQGQVLCIDGRKTDEETFAGLVLPQACLAGLKRQPARFGRTRQMLNQHSDALGLVAVAQKREGQGWIADVH